mmetsp:Transcript_18883/g.61629  ORF Transcript_18883/g.61629 Transcript_18883/m.61629 type:complete len:288 (-) Transcript_18883:374-1237(-)
MCVIADPSMRTAYTRFRRVFASTTRPHSGSYAMWLKKASPPPLSVSSSDCTCTASPSSSCGLKSRSLRFISLPASRSGSLPSIQKTLSTGSPSNGRNATAQDQIVSPWPASWPMATLSQTRKKPSALAVASASVSEDGGEKESPLTSLSWRSSVMPGDRFASASEHSMGALSEGAMLPASSESRITNPEEPAAPANTSWSRGCQHRRTASVLLASVSFMAYNSCSSICPSFSSMLHTSTRPFLSALARRLTSDEKKTTSESGAPCPLTSAREAVCMLSTRIAPVFKP